MATAFKTVQDAIVAALLQAPQITGSRVWAGRARTLAEEHASDINVTIARIDGQDLALTAAPVSWRVTYGLQVRARGGPAVDAIAACDPLLEAVYARLAATTPPAGVAGLHLDPRVDLDIEEAATPIGVATLFITAQMRTQPGVLTLAA